MHDSMLLDSILDAKHSNCNKVRAEQVFRSFDFPLLLDSR